MGGRLDEGLILLQGCDGPQGGKSMCALRSHRSALEFLMEPPVNYPDTDVGDVAFVKATGAIGDHDAVEEYLACVLYCLSAGLSLGEVADGITLVSKLKVMLPKFCVVRSDEDRRCQVLARVELEAGNVVGSYGRTEHDACIKCLPNGCAGVAPKSLSVSIGDLWLRSIALEALAARVLK
jgi:hypothetical protein